MGSDGMTIRPWEEKDLKTLSEMESRCFSDPWTKEMLADVLRYPFYNSFLAEEGGQVCGYACLISLFEDAEVANVAVDVPFRGRGIGKALMDAMHERARSLGATQCLLEVRVSNVAAIGLYKKYGYVRYGVRKNYYEDGEDAFVMKKTL